MKNYHGNLSKTLNLDNALSSLQDGSSSLHHLSHLLLNFRKGLGHSYAPRVYAYMLLHGLETHTLLGNYLVCVLVENGDVGNAHQVFDRLVHPNESSWNALIVGYIKFGKPEHGFTLFTCMEKDASIRPTVHTFVALLKACAKLNDLEKGIELYNKITSMELETNPFVGSALVDMCAKCGCVANAQKVFDKLPFRDVITWTGLIKGYVEHKNSEAALQCFEQMQCEGVLADPVVLICILKACSTLEDAKKGQIVHVQIRQQASLASNHLFIGSALVDMYAKCGCFAAAQHAFKEVMNKNVVVWNALLQGYGDHGHDEEALECFEQMQSEGIHPNAVTFVCCLKACIGTRAIDKGQEIHAEVEKLGLLEQNIYICSTLVDMYGKFGMLAEAQQVFNKISDPNVVSWTALIRGYAEQGSADKAVRCFELMQLANVAPNPVTFVSILLACVNQGAVYKGLELHAEICRRGLLQNIYVGSTLVDLYSKCGLLAKAREVFEILSVQDVVSWNALIAGYAEHGDGQEALDCFEQMQVKGISPNEVTHICIIKACGNVGAIYKGIELHAEFERQGILVRNPFVGGALIDMYANCFLLSKAQDVFDKLRSQDLVSWNALISGYAEKGHGKKALESYEQMQLKGVCPDAVTFVCTLKACASTGATGKCREICAQIEREGMLEKDVVLGNILVDTLAKCNLVSLAQEVFDKLSVRNVVAWTALTAGYGDHGQGEQALKCFEQMHLEGVAPNAFTYASTLKACGSIGALSEGQEIHNDIERRGLLEDDLVIGNILIDMYARVGSPIAARQVFDKLLVRDVVSWTALIVALCEHGEDNNALNCLEQMRLEGVYPDGLTLISCLRACGNVGALDTGEEIHSEIERCGLLLNNRAVGNTLVDMYAKCGFLTKARKVFDRLPVRDVVSWTALIAGYAQLGDGENAFITFNEMLRNAIKPDPIIFVVLLSACSRSGLVNRSQTYYEAMSKEYGIVPSLEHQTCIVDSLGRAGQVSRIVSMMERMPVCDAVVWWQTVLGTCRISGNIDIGQHAFEHAVQPCEKGPLAPALMCEVYGASELEEPVNKAASVS